MDLNELFQRHRSIRKYLPDDVSPILIRQLLQTAVTGASSSGNLSATSFVMTRDPQKKKELFAIHSKQSMILDAPLVITVCADFHRMRSWLHHRHARDNFNNFLGFLKGIVDSVILAQNLVLACENQGLGICYLGTTWNASEDLIKLLHLPETVFPITSFVVGYPAESPAPRDRLPVEAYIHEEFYHRPTPGDIEQIYHEREAKGWARYQSIPEYRQSMEAAGIQNLAQFYTSEGKYPRSAYLEISQKILKMMQKQGFLDPEELKIIRNMPIE